MSNHDGSHMLNQVLHLLEQRDFFGFLGKEGTMDFIQKVLRLGREWDCTDGKILENGMGRRLCICSCCHKFRDPADFDGDDGLCKACLKS